MIRSRVFQEEARLYFNKSLVPSFSSFEKPIIARLSLQAPGLIWDMTLYCHGCSALADWLRAIVACGT